MAHRKVKPFWLNGKRMAWLIRRRVGIGKWKDWDGLFPTKGEAAKTLRKRKKEHPTWEFKLAKANRI